MEHTLLFKITCSSVLALPRHFPSTLVLPYHQQASANIRHCPDLTANGRIPAIVDRTKGPDGQPQNRRVFEGASLLLYLTARYDPHHKISYPYDSDDYWEMVNFLAWQHGGIGPMQVGFLFPFPLLLTRQNSA